MRLYPSWRRWLLLLQHLPFQSLIKNPKIIRGSPTWLKHPQHEKQASTVHLEKIANYSENWQKQVTPILDSVEISSKGLASQVEGLQTLFQKFSENFIQSKEEIIKKKFNEKNKKD